MAALHLQTGMDTYALVINYAADKTTALDIEKSIAAVGYDTQNVKAEDTAYKKLPKCCRYDREKDSTKQD